MGNFDPTKMLKGMSIIPKPKPQVEDEIEERK